MAAHSSAFYQATCTCRLQAGRCSLSVLLPPAGTSPSASALPPAGVPHTTPAPCTCACLPACPTAADGSWVSMGVYSDGSYGAPAGVVYSFPVTCKDGKWSIVQVRWVGGGWGEKVDWGGGEAAEAAAGTLRSVPPLEHHAQVSSHPTRRTQAHACMHPCTLMNHTRCPPLALPA